ncbi:hypothetical protein [Streptomyces sp. Ncost-T10-10d]|uniref:hypothetical protein n=1 Tax=Streptomyces sp. Ncost-T10-10d TaxID=1839774 RepID=UPI00081E0DA3|nr:Response regulator receiver domain-containing protein [Streptomyces sp. Ncost-T10-10d]
MDIRLPGMVGIGATGQIISGPGRTHVVVLTTFDDDCVYAALRAGASGFLVGDTALDEIVAVVRVVGAGEGPIPQRRPTTDQGVRRPSVGGASTTPRRAISGITDQERGVLTLIGRGMSDAEPAEQLVIRVATAKSFVTRLLAELDARERVQW